MDNKLVTNPIKVEYIRLRKRKINENLSIYFQDFKLPTI